jgi:hypothetical protein
VIRQPNHCERVLTFNEYLAALHFRHPITIETDATLPGRYTDSVQLELRSITVRRADSRGQTVWSS